MARVIAALALFSSCAASQDTCDDDDPDCWASHLEVSVDGEPAALDEIATEIAFPPGGESPTASNDVVFAGGDGVILKVTADLMPQPTAVSGTIEGLWAASDTDVWAVGGAAVLHFDGASWSRLPDSSAALHAVWGSGPDDVWLVGDQGTVFRWGASGAVRVPAGTASSLRAVGGRSPSDVWIGGVNFLAHWDGTAFTPSSVNATVTGIWGDSAGHAVFTTDRPPLVGWDGTMLRTLSGTQSFAAVHGIGSTAFAVGSMGQLATIDTTTLTMNLMNLGALDLRGVWTSPSAQWLVGRGGTIVLRGGGGGGQRMGGADLIAVTGAPLTRSPATGPLAPRFLTQPAPITVDTASPGFTEVELEWEDPNGDLFPSCFSPCSKTARCSARSLCTQRRRDFRVRGYVKYGVRFKAKPKSGAAKVPLRVKPMASAPDGGLASATGPDGGKGAVVGGAHVTVDLDVKGPTPPPAGGTGGGGEGGTCAHCVDGQPCAACAGKIACGGTTCCNTGETCMGRTCVRGSSGHGPISVGACSSFLTEPCAMFAGGCCPACMTCDSSSVCHLP